MTIIGRDSRIKALIEGLGVSTKKMVKCTINMPCDDLVTIEATYLAEVLDKDIKEITKLFKLVEAEEIKEVVEEKEACNEMEMCPALISKEYPDNFVKLEFKCAKYGERLLDKNHYTQPCKQCTGKIKTRTPKGPETRTIKEG